MLAGDRLALKEDSLRLELGNYLRPCDTERLANALHTNSRKIPRVGGTKPDESHAPPEHPTPPPALAAPPREEPSLQRALEADVIGDATEPCTETTTGELPNGSPAAMVLGAPTDAPLVDGSSMPTPRTPRGRSKIQANPLAQPLEASVVKIKRIGSKNALHELSTSPPTPRARKMETTKSASTSSPASSPDPSPASSLSPTLPRRATKQSAGAQGLHSAAESAPATAQRTPRASKDPDASSSILSAKKASANKNLPLGAAGDKAERAKGSGYGVTKKKAKKVEEVVVEEVRCIIRKQ